MNKPIHKVLASAARLFASVAIVLTLLVLATTAQSLGYKFIAFIARAALHAFTLFGVYSVLIPRRTIQHLRDVPVGGTFVLGGMEWTRLKDISNRSQLCFCHNETMEIYASLPGCLQVNQD